QRLRDSGRVFVILAVTERDPDGLYLTCFALEEVSQ
ncbi:MAG: head-tail adaptor protein, partial [Paracoccaceae bacterium]